MNRLARGVASSSTICGAAGPGIWPRMLAAKADHPQPAHPQRRPALRPAAPTPRRSCGTCCAGPASTMPTISTHRWFRMAAVKRREPGRQGSGMRSTHDADSDVEAIVVGGGPAGSITAAVLAEAGHRVLLLDKSALSPPQGLLGVREPGGNAAAWPTSACSMTSSPWARTGWRRCSSTRRTAAGSRPTSHGRSRGAPRSGCPATGSTTCCSNARERPASTSASGRTCAMSSRQRSDVVGVSARSTGRGRRSGRRSSSAPMAATRRSRAVSGWMHRCAGRARPGSSPTTGVSPGSTRFGRDARRVATRTPDWRRWKTG